MKGTLFVVVIGLFIAFIILDSQGVNSQDVINRNSPLSGTAVPAVVIVGQPANGQPVTLATAVPPAPTAVPTLIVLPTVQVYPTAVPVESFEVYNPNVVRQPGEAYRVNVDGWLMNCIEQANGKSPICAVVGKAGE